VPIDSDVTIVTKGLKSGSVVVTGNIGLQGAPASKQD